MNRDLCVTEKYMSHDTGDLSAVWAVTCMERDAWCERTGPAFKVRAERCRWSRNRRDASSATRKTRETFELLQSNAIPLHGESEQCQRDAATVETPHSEGLRHSLLRRKPAFSRHGRCRYLQINMSVNRAGRRLLSAAGASAAEPAAAAALGSCAPRLLQLLSRQVVKQNLQPSPRRAQRSLPGLCFSSFDPRVRACPPSARLPPHPPHRSLTLSSPSPSMVLLAAASQPTAPAAHKSPPAATTAPPRRRRATAWATCLAAAACSRSSWR